MCFPFFKAQGHDGRRLAVRGGGRRAGAARARRGAAAARPAAARRPRARPTRFAADTERRELDGVDVPDGWMGLDVGAAHARSATRERDRAAPARVFWNGPMGAFELEPFAAGTRAVAEAVADAPGTTVVGGGDSAAALRAVRAGRTDVTHLSTGGGASLELLEGKTLPGVEVLRMMPTARR